LPGVLGQECILYLEDGGVPVPEPCLGRHLDYRYWVQWFRPTRDTRRLESQNRRNLIVILVICNLYLSLAALVAWILHQGLDVTRLLCALMGVWGTIWFPMSFLYVLENSRLDRFDARVWIGQGTEVLSFALVLFLAYVYPVRSVCWYLLLFHVGVVMPILQTIRTVIWVGRLWIYVLHRQCPCLSLSCVCNE
jgi:hypothetical protein